MSVVTYQKEPEKLSITKFSGNSFQDMLCLNWPGRDIRLGGSLANILSPGCVVIVLFNSARLTQKEVAWVNGEMKVHCQSISSLSEQLILYEMSTDLRIKKYKWLY